MAALVDHARHSVFFSIRAARGVCSGMCGVWVLPPPSSLSLHRRRSEHLVGSVQVGDPGKGALGGVLPALDTCQASCPADKDPALEASEKAGVGVI